MTKMAMTFAAVLALAVGAAQARTTVTDTEGNGLFSVKDLVLAFPDLTPALFTAAAADADDVLSVDELKSAQTAGTIPA